MSITQLMGALGAHRYLLVFVLLAAYARRLTAPDSKFPITVPDAWRPVVTTVFGVAYGVLATIQAGANWRSAVIGGVVSAATAGFADMLLVAIFSDPARAPAWARALAFLFDDLKGSSPTPKRGPTAPPDTNSGSNGPALRTGSMVAVVATAAFLTGCANAPPPKVPSDLANEYSCVEGDLSRGIISFAQIEADCSPGQIGTVVDIVDWILASADRAQKFATLAPALQTELRSARPVPSHWPWVGSAIACAGTPATCGAHDQVASAVGGRARSPRDLEAEPRWVVGFRGQPIVGEHSAIPRHRITVRRRRLPGVSASQRSTRATQNSTLERLPRPREHDGHVLYVRYCLAEEDECLAGASLGVRGRLGAGARAPASAHGAS